MKVDIRGLEVFRAIMRTGTLSKAAVELHTSQPTASAILKRLEDSIDICLFERTPFGLTPTPEAALLLPEVERIFSHLEHVKEKIENISHGENSFLSVQSLPSMSKHFVVPSIKLFSERYPRAHISIHSGQSTQVINSVEVGAFDVGFVYGIHKSQMLEYIPLSSIKFECIVRQEHPLVKKGYLEPEDLNGERLIMNRIGTDLRNAVDNAYIQHGLQNTPVIETGTLQAYDLINAGVGIGILDTSLLGKTHYPSLVAVPTFLNITEQACLIYNKISPISSLAKEYIDLCLVHFSEGSR